MLIWRARRSHFCSSRAQKRASDGARLSATRRRATITGARRRQQAAPPFNRRARCNLDRSKRRHRLLDAAGDERAGGRGGGRAAGRGGGRASGVFTARACERCSPRRAGRSPVVNVVHEQQARARARVPTAMSIARCVIDAKCGRAASRLEPKNKQPRRRRRAASAADDKQVERRGFLVFGVLDGQKRSVENKMRARRRRRRRRPSAQTTLVGQQKGQKRRRPSSNALRQHEKGT